MKEVILLTKVLLKCSKSNTKKEYNKKSHFIFTTLVFLFIYMYLAGIMAYASYGVIKELMAIGEEKIFLNLCFMVAMGFSVFQTIFTSLNVLFFSKDLENLLPFPIKPVKIVMAKFNCLVISQYMMYSIMLLPLFVVYGYLLKCGIMYYLYVLLILLAFPIIPVAITTLLVTIIMKLTNIIKDKESVQYLTVFITIAFIIGVQFLFGYANNEISNEELTSKVIATNESISGYINIFTNMKFSIETLNNYNNVAGILNFIVFCTESAVIYIVISFITAKFYIKTVTRLMTNGIKKRKKIDINKAYSKHSIQKTYIKKEIRELVRNPIFFMQCVLPPVLFPLIFLVPIMMPLTNAESDIKVLQGFLKNYVNTGMGLVACIEIIELFFIFNFTAITSISRDGSTAKFMKYFPIDLQVQCKYKIMPAIVLNIFPILYVVVALKVLLPQTQILTLIYITVLAMLLNIFNNWMVILVDLKNPKIDWMTEYAVVKQNLNMFYQMVIIFTQMGIILAIGVNIYSLNLSMLIFSAIFIIATIIVKRHIKINQRKLFKNII